MHRYDTATPNVPMETFSLGNTNLVSNALNACLSAQASSARLTGYDHPRRRANGHTFKQIAYTLLMHPRSV